MVAICYAFHSTSRPESSYEGCIMFVKPAKTMNFFRSVFLVLLEKIVLCFRKPTQSTHPGADWNFQKGQRTFACRQLIFRGARISNTHNMSSGMFIFESTREHRAFHREFLSISKDASVFKPPVRTPICWISFIFGATGTSTSLLHLWDFPSTHNPHTLPSGVVHFENMCGNRAHALSCSGFQKVRRTCSSFHLLSKACRGRRESRSLLSSTSKL
jgi:hypothetical protein